MLSNVLRKTKQVPLWLWVALFSTLLALTSGIIIHNGLPEQILVAFLPPVLIMGVLSSRAAYSIMLAMWTIMMVWIVVYVSDDLRASLTTISASVPTLAAMTEFLRLAVRQRRRAEDALRQSERRYRRLIEESPDGIVLFSEGKMMFANPTAVCLVGASGIHELMNRSVLGFVHPEDRPRALNHMRDVMAAGKGLPPCEIRLLRLDGQTTDVEFTGMPFEQKGHQGTHIVLHDITEKKRAQEEKAKLEAQVRYAQKLESLGILAGGIAHDFNNLLVGILGNANLSLTEMPQDSPYREPVYQIEVSARRAADLANEMLAYSGKGPFVTCPLDISKILSDMKQLPKAAISKKTEVRYGFASDLPAVEGDENQLRQVFVNLILNAGEAIGDAEGLIDIQVDTVEAQRAYLSDTVVDDELPEGTYVRIQVSDTGCGIDKTVLSRIFEPFYTTKAPGRGLGLAAVVGLVRGHRGALKVHSSPGHGSTFTVLLPASQAKPEPEQPPKKADVKETRLRQGTGTILVADDEKIVRELAKAVLSRAGFNVLTANDGQDAVDLFRTQPEQIALVLLDMTMPRMSGGEALNQIRRTHPDTPVLLSSGYSEEDVATIPKGDAKAKFIQKPYLATELLSKIHEVLQS